MRFFFGSSCTYKASFSTYMIVKLEKIFKFKIFQAVFVKKNKFLDRVFGEMYVK